MRHLRNLWPLIAFAGAVAAEHFSTRLGLRSGLLTVGIEVLFSAWIFASVLRRKLRWIWSLVPAGFGIGDLTYGLNHYIFKEVYTGPFEPLIYAVPYVIGMTVLTFALNRLQRMSMDSLRMRQASLVGAGALLALNAIYIVIPTFYRTPAPAVTVAVLSVVFSVLESLIIAQAAVLMLVCRTSAVQAGLFGLLVIHVSDIALRFQSVYLDQVGLGIFEFGWFVGLAMATSAVNLWRADFAQFSRLSSVRTWVIGFVLLGLALGWFGLAFYLGAMDANRIAATILILLAVFGFTILGVGIVTKDLERLVKGIQSGRGLQVVTGGSVPEEVTLNQQVVSERDHALNLSAEIAHNLGSPLMALKAAEHNIREHVSQGCETCAALNDELPTLGVVVDAIDDVSARVLQERKRLVGIETIDKSVHAAVALVSAIHPDRRIEVVVDRDASVVPAVGLKEVVRNLLENALHASKTAVTVSARAENAGYLVEIVDRGSGIPENLLNAIREGQTLTSKVNGNGIGLASAFSWAKARGYGLAIDSSVKHDDHGTRIQIRIPRSAWAAPKNRMESLEA